MVYFSGTTDVASRGKLRTTLEANVPALFALKAQLERMPTYGRS